MDICDSDNGIPINETNNTTITIIDGLNKLIIDKDSTTKMIRCDFMEDEKGFIINTHMWMIYNNDQIEGENWDFNKLVPDLTNYEGLTDIAILTKIKNRFLKNKFDSKFTNLLLVLSYYSF